MIIILITDYVFAVDAPAENQQTLDGTRIAIIKETLEQIINRIEDDNIRNNDAIWKNGIEKQDINIENIVRSVCRQILRLARWIDFGISEENQEKYLSLFAITSNQWVWVNSKTNDYPGWLKGVADEYLIIETYIKHEFPDYAFPIDNNVEYNNGNSALSTGDDSNAIDEPNAEYLGSLDSSDAYFSKNQNQSYYTNSTRDSSNTTGNKIDYTNINTTSTRRQTTTTQPTTKTPSTNESRMPETTAIPDSTDIDDDIIPGTGNDIKNDLPMLIALLGLVFALLSCGGVVFLYMKLKNMSIKQNKYNNSKNDISVNNMNDYGQNIYTSTDTQFIINDDISIAGKDQRLITKLHSNYYDYKKYNDKRVSNIEKDLNKIADEINFLHTSAQPTPSPTPTPIPYPEPHPSPYPSPSPSSMPDPSKKKRNIENDLINELVSYYNEVINKRLSYRDFEKAYELKACNINAFSERQSFSIHDDYEDKYFWAVIFENANDSEKCYVIPSLRKIISDKSRTSGFNTSGINGLFHSWETTDLSISVLVKPAIFEYRDKKLAGDQPIQQGILRININSRT